MAFNAAFAIFLGAFLLFLVQPVIGKMILPWFGGTPAVWTSCMLFFQVLLLAGYAYAAVLNRWLRPTYQVLVHLVLLSAALLLLPITPSTHWKPLDGEYPVWRILVLLCACVGAPYFLLSATSPLVQSLFAYVYPGRSPYRLYALSNIGSLGALLLYPFVVEPALTTTQQGSLWSGGFLLFALGYGSLAILLRRHAASLTTTVDSPSIESVETKDEEISWRLRWRWIWLPALASMLLLSITNHLCQDVAVVPFLWIVPLGLYLISLIICFDRDKWYKPRLFGILAIVAILVACDIAFITYLTQTSSKPLSLMAFILRYDIRVLVAVYLSLFFFVCMLCHGEVVRSRPQAGRLTEFYLTISAGGALGGFLVAIVCPTIFRSFIELKIGLIVSFLLATKVVLRDFGIMGRERKLASTKSSSSAKAKMKRETGQINSDSKVSKVSFSSTRRLLVGSLALILVLVVVGAQYLSLESVSANGPLTQVRNFYGTLAVREWYPEDDPLHGRALYHGAILHGYQFLDSDRELEPTTYYSAQSGVGIALNSLRGQGAVKVGVVGLGIGTLAAYAQYGDTYRFYEINPLVIKLAKNSFSFLERSQAKLELVSGDARLSLEREEDQGFDVLVLDAFSGDSIPVHLLTREAMQVYRRHLKPNGMIAVHVSNRYVDLLPVVKQLGAEFEFHQAKVRQEESEGLHLSSSDWMLLALDPKSLEHPSLSDYILPAESIFEYRVWTDDYNNLFQALKHP